MSLVGKSALLIDDDPELRAIVEKILTNVGVRVFQAGSVDQAFTVINDAHPHLIFLDLNLQRESGFVFLEKFRESPDFKVSPVVVLSARADRESIHTARSLGAKDFLPKPVQASLLLQKARKLLRSGDFFSLDFSQPVEVQVKVPGTIVQGSELGFLFESSVRFSPDSVVSLDSSVCQEIGLKIAPLFKSAATPPKFVKKGDFIGDLRFMGLSVEQTEKLRESLRKWHTK